MPDSMPVPNSGLPGGLGGPARPLTTDDIPALANAILGKTSEQKTKAQFTPATVLAQPGDTGDSLNHVQIHCDGDPDGNVTWASSLIGDLAPGDRVMCAWDRPGACYVIGHQQPVVGTAGCPECLFVASSHEVLVPPDGVAAAIVWDVDETCGTCVTTVAQSDLPFTIGAPDDVLFPDDTNQLIVFNIEGWYEVTVIFGYGLFLPIPATRDEAYFTFVSTVSGSPGGFSPTVGDQRTGDDVNGSATNWCYAFPGATLKVQATWSTSPDTIPGIGSQGFSARLLIRTLCGACGPPIDHGGGGSGCG